MSATITTTPAPAAAVVAELAFQTWKAFRAARSAHYIAYGRSLLKGVGYKDMPECDLSKQRSKLAAAKLSELVEAAELLTRREGAEAARMLGLPTSHFRKSSRYERTAAFWRPALHDSDRCPFVCK